MSDTSVTSRDLALLRDIVHLTGRERPEDPDELSFQVLDLLEHLQLVPGAHQATRSVRARASHRPPVLLIQ